MLIYYNDIIPTRNFQYYCYIQFHIISLNTIMDSGTLNMEVNHAMDDIRDASNNIASNNDSSSTDIPMLSVASTESLGVENTEETPHTTQSTYSTLSLRLGAKSPKDMKRKYLLKREIVLLEQWRSKISIYREATYRANIWYKQWDTALGIIPIILNAVVVMIKGYEFTHVDIEILKYITFAMIAIATIVQTIHSFLKLSKQSENMRHICDKLAGLELTAQIYLAQREQPIIPPVVFIDMMHRDITKLIEEAENIPTVIMSKFYPSLSLG